MYANYNSFQSLTVIPEKDVHTPFRDDVFKGLSGTPKKLSSKYFYDKRGDELFQQIMHMPEYYLTGCELEIFRKQTKSLVNAIGNHAPFDLIEMGVGDGTKSIYLLEELLKQNQPFTYFPIDISGNVLRQVKRNLATLGQLNMTPLEGDYFDMLAKATQLSDERKVILFLGANVGNMSKSESLEFCQRLRSYLQPGDRVIIGVDLKKNPHSILRAYNDPQGITRDFNLNLLERINRELGGNFDVGNFTHYQTYDPDTGSCKSYLVSSNTQIVRVGNETFSFMEVEWIFMEVSQKFAPDEIQTLAIKSGFVIDANLMDSKGWFIDTVWTAN